MVEKRWNTMRRIGGGDVETSEMVEKIWNFVTENYHGEFQTIGLIVFIGFYKDNKMYSLKLVR